MLFESEFVSLIFYALQQLGVMLGVGAETVLLLSYLLAMRDGVVEQKEERFAHAVSRVLNAGLILIVVSGAGIFAIHALMRDFDVILSPVFLFKWVLIGVTIVCAFLIQKKIFPQGKLEMLAGGTWYALFIVHILAPVTSWFVLFVLYGVWLIGFSLCWYALTRFTQLPRPSPKDTVVQPRTVPAPVVVPPAPKKVEISPPLPAVALAKEGPKPVPPPPPLPAVALAKEGPKPAPVAVVPVVQKEHNLPAIRIMPQHPDDFAKNRH